MQEYKQMELDTRGELTRAVASLTAETIDTIQNMISRCGEAPAAVRNRHEAYGIAAEHFGKISAIVKSIKNDCGTLLGTLADPNSQAVEATSSIANSTAEAAATLLIAAAEMKRTLSNLYIAESSEQDQTPMEAWTDESANFEEVEPAEADEADAEN